jgi:hypothetical protein
MNLFHLVTINLACVWYLSANIWILRCFAVTRLIFDCSISEKISNVSIISSKDNNLFDVYTCLLFA